MPSPTATMRPTSAETRLASKSFKRSLMTSEISRVLMLNLSLLRGRQPAAQLLAMFGGDRGIAQDRRHLRVGEQLADFNQTARPLVDLAILQRQLEDGPRVAPGGATRARHRIFVPQSPGAVTSHSARGGRRHEL